jgi:uncharacterized protein
MKRQTLSALLALCLLACPSTGSSGKSTRPTPPADAGWVDVTSQNYAAPPLPRGVVILQDAFGGHHRVPVEVASTNPTRQRGLMWRTELAEGKGMLFIFPTERMNSFWMENTLIALDMIFITEDLHIAGIVKNAEPRTRTSRFVGKQSKYVLEVPGGWSDKIGLNNGAPVAIEGISMIPVE